MTASPDPTHDRPRSTAESPTPDRTAGHSPSFGRRALLAAAGGAVVGTALGTGTASADATIAINPATKYGTWEGWGTSLAWWANVFGARDDFADLWFTTKTTTYNGTALPGLGMNIARYNLGACSSNSINGESMVKSPNIPAFKQIEGFWQDYTNENPTSSAWKWTADTNQRAALTKAVARGATTELFANSPMWWMCSNHNPSGASGGGNNLQTWNYRQHASHLAATALYAKNNWGVNFATVDPFNEPASTWWTAAGTQEGCHMDPAVQAAVLPYMRSELDARGLTSVRISASDETNYDTARSTWNSFNASTRSLVSQVNVHGYQGANGRRDLLYTDVVTTAGKKLWNSETGDSDGTGWTLARNLCYDFRWLHPTAWVYWQVMDPTAGWGMIKYDANTLQPGAIETKYYVMAQFSRHIRPGMTILDAGSSYTAAAYDAAARRLVIVAINTATTAQTFTFNLSGFTTVTGGTNGLVPRWNTHTSGGTDRYRAYSDTRLNGKSVAVPFAAGAVQTLQIDGVTI
ncbi:beta-1,6-galactanase [Streptomyces caniscabiei]|uniref:beta-1,6-galactanase n=1 Tax=Streptomyces caniscabiei TaxID=2746961 RepID=UPI0029BC5AC1|nr:beta-1,6-galactanase [Streptomyces caniscabiei]MDX2606315.1 beta-1,6-galactanase [Streptomyces caniscabiei]MDX2740063.1 beta-1,6-galactanase [Streptomyces caniscabiei]MDX2783642.1 beta-1,6-galactanase [Streptomyces caniscabiei]